MYKYVKRLLDIIISICFLVVAIIPMLLIAIAIKLDSKGPVLFKQKRTGYKGKEFNLYKFRSMSYNNDYSDTSKENEFTRVGKFIRKYSLDELPQVLNILFKNDMSWIGPRPWVPEYYKNFTKYQKRRCDVKPGITGLAQCSGRNNLTVFDKINYDIEYVDNISLLLDIKIVFKTIKAILKKEGVEISKLGIKEEIDQLHDNYIYVTGSIPVIDERNLEELSNNNA